MKRFRQVIFWLHLAAGIVAGVVVLVMSLTGAALAFEKEIVAWAERDLRQVALPATNAVRLPVDELLAKVRAKQPEARPASVTLFADPQLAMTVGFGRTNAAYVNPYTGEVRDQGATRLRAFMQVMIEWHRWLGVSTDNRPVGRAITGACNAAFLFLAGSGLYLWWPRQWTRKVLRASALMNLSLRGKARDWNWHNALGLWTAPVLIVLTATAMPISYRWAGDLIYKLTGTEAPPAGAGPGGGGPAIELPKPEPGAKPLGYDALLAVVQKQAPAWEQMTLRLGGPAQRGGQGGQSGAASGERGNTREGGARERREGAPEGRQRSEVRNGEGRSGSSPQPVSISVKERDQRPRFAAAQFTLNPFTGDVLRQESFADYNRGRQVRSWTRFLHTGEALGWIGQAVAGLASLGTAILVWTGFALAWRRLFQRRAVLPQPAENPEAAVLAVNSEQV